jgi:phenylacetic acid degradation operon negative regulatory protein
MSAGTVRHDVAMPSPQTPPTEPPLPMPSARSVLLTVMGDFGYTFDEPVWTTTLITVMRLLGVDELATRQAIRRTAATGWIERERRGKSVAWRLAPAGRRVAEEGRERAEEFTGPPEPWDGLWFTLTVSVPPKLSRTRLRRFSGGLTWLRLGNLAPGVWVSPRASCGPAVRELVDHFELSDTSIGVAGRLEVGLDDHAVVRRAWDLTELSSSYQRLLDQYGDVDPQTPDELLRTYLVFRNFEQRFMRLDPLLPVELNPDWVGRDAASLIGESIARWTGLAEARWLELNRAAAAPEPA